MTFIPIVDALLEVLRPAVGTMTIDDAATEPTKAQPDRLYLWPRRLSPQRLEEANGRWDEATVRLRALVTLANLGETRVARAQRNVTVQLDDLTDALIAAIAANRKAKLWWDLYVENVVPDAVRTFAIRGYGLDIAVRANVPQDLGA